MFYVYYRYLYDDLSIANVVLLWLLTSVASICFGSLSLTLPYPSLPFHRPSLPAPGSHLYIKKNTIGYVTAPPPPKAFGTF